MPSSLRVHPDEGVVRLELTGPDGYPRLSAALLDSLDAQLSALLADGACGGIVIHGSSRCFAAGAEIAEVGSLTGVSALPFARHGQLLLEKIARASKPIVAAVTGYCLGGGFDLAVACHWRLATPDAQFGHPGVTLGLLTGWGGTQRLPRLIGRARSLGMLLTGEGLGAQQALEFGLVDEIVSPDALLPRSRERARPRADLTQVEE